MTRDQDQFRIPKLPFVFDFNVNPNWPEALDNCRQDGWFTRELPNCEEDLEIIMKSVSIIFTDCSTRKLCFLTKAYMIFLHLLDVSEFDSLESTESKIDYLEQCHRAYQSKNDSKLKELNPYFFKLIQLFKDYQIDQTKSMMNESDDEQYSIDNLMESLITSLNEIMLKADCEHEELNCSINSMNIDEKINSFLDHNVNHYGVILAKLFFNQKMICDQIENDKLYKELKNCISKAISIMDDIYSFSMEYAQFQQSDQMNFITKLSEWLNVSIPQALQIAPDYVDEQLQRFDFLSKKLIDKYNLKTCWNYIDFWKKMYVAALLFCTQTPRYSRFFNQPIVYKFLNKFNTKT